MTKRNTPAFVPEAEQPYKIPHNWRWVRLGTVCDFIGGGTPSKKRPEYWDGSIPWASVKDIKGMYLTDTIDTTTEAGLQNSASNLCDIGDLIMITRIEPAKTVIAKIVTAINQDLKILKSPLSSLFLHYYFRAFQQSFLDMASGSTVLGVTISNVENAAFPLPPLAEQQRIIDCIESLFIKLDAARDDAQAVVDGFELRKAAILYRAFSGKLTATHSYETVPLSMIVKEIRIGPFGSALHKDDYVSDKIPVINPKHIVNQNIIPDSKTSISEEKARELSAYILRKNDIILARRGVMGRSAPVTEKEEGWLCGTGSMIIRLKDGYDATIYSQILSSGMSVRYLEENAVGSTMSNLNEKIIRDLPVPNFSVYEQEKILAITSDLLNGEYQVMKSAQQVIDNIDAMKKAILGRAFRGELGTNDPSEASPDLATLGGAAE